MDRDDLYSLQALDFTKRKNQTETPKNDDDLYPSVLDLSVHHSEPENLSSAVSSHSSFQSNIRSGAPVTGKDYLIKEPFSAGDIACVPEDLRIATCSSVKHFSTEHHPKTPGKHIKQLKDDLRDICVKQDRLTSEMFNKEEEKAHSVFPGSVSTAENLTNSEHRNAELSFHFGLHSDKMSNVSLASGAIHSAVLVEDTTANESEQHRCPSFEFGITAVNADPDEEQKKTTLHYCSEAAISDMARSSFGVLPQSEDSQDGQGKKRYDEYAKQFADFLKSTASNQKVEQDSISNSEESQASEGLSMNVGAEEGASLSADVAVANEKETSILASEDVSREAEDVGEAQMDVEECNEESLLETRSDVAKVEEESVTATEPPALADVGETKKRRKHKNAENSESPSSSKPKRKRMTLPQATETIAQASSLAAANVFEYQWPQERSADWFVLQEHISEFLGVLSFKRKHPDIFRRQVDIHERNFLRDAGVVTEMQCDLGLTALKTEEVCELMSRDYPEKYQEYATVLRERQKIAEANKVLEMANVEKAKMENLVKKSIKMAAEYNANLMRELRQERKAYFDLQTFEVHYPHKRLRCDPKEATKIGSYPVSVLPGQYQDYYKRYTPQELKYFPLNTALYSPHKMLKSIFSDPNSNAVDDTEEDEDGPDEANDHISIQSSVDQTVDDSESVTIEKEKREEKGPNENVDQEKQKPAAVSLDQDDSLGLLDDSAENSRSSFKDKRSGKTPSAARRVKRLPVKKKGRELTLKCGVCNNSKIGEAEDVVHCSECGSTGHPSCLELTKDMVAVIKTYPWQCMECKTCVKCMDPHDEEKMMFCDRCDRGYHTFCVGLKSIPEGRWECPSCRDVITPSKPKRGRPFKYPRPQTSVDHVEAKTETA